MRLGKTWPKTMAITVRILTGRARGAVLAVVTSLATYGGKAWQQVRENAPVVGRHAARQRASIVLEPYKRSHSLKRTIAKVVGLPALALTCLIYGFLFGLTAPTLIVAFAVPIVVLAALVIWALPDQNTAPTLPMEFLYPAFIVALVAWPNYVAISLPGLPWITMLRIIGLPMAGVLLICLSVSPEFRQKTSEAMSSIKLLMVFMWGFVALQIATLLVSKAPAASAQLVFNQQIYWTAIFVIGCAIFRDVRQVERYFALLCMLSIPIIALSIIEQSEQHVLWMNHIPKILLPPDPTIRNILTPNFRAGTYVYRVRTTFSTPLAEAEYLCLLTPILLHFIFTSRRTIVRIASIILIPLLFISIRLTDSRLGVVGMLVSFLLYGVLWSIGRWRAHPKDLLAAATVYAYPAIFIGGIGLVFASHRFHDMVFGGNAQASSTAARDNQLSMAFSAFEKAPWGVGTGQSGNVMGYAPGDFIAIDNYFIGILLEYGALGVVAWYGMFIVAIVEATRHSLSAQYAGRLEARLLAPLAVALCAFLVIKWVHGDAYTHSIDFMMLGMVSALVYNLQHGSPSVKGVTSAAGSMPPPRSKPASDANLSRDRVRIRQTVD
jgi:hypothetical protein